MHICSVGLMLTRSNILYKIYIQFSNFANKLLYLSYLKPNLDQHIIMQRCIQISAG